MRGTKEFDSLPGEFDPAKTSDFNVLIAYDTPHSARSAMQLVDGLVEQVGGELDTHRNLWRFDILGLADAHAAAMAYAANANLVIVATGSRADLSAPVKTWLKAWSAESVPGTAALVALLFPQRPKAPRQSSARRFLQGIAAKAGQDFFAHEIVMSLPATEITVEMSDGAWTARGSYLFCSTFRHAHPVIPHL